MRLTNISVIKDLINRHGFTFTKSLGQNFLINPSVCPRMVQGLIGTVIEIGAGIGVLTRELSNVAERVIVIEIDKKLKPILDETLMDCNNVSIIWGDVLKLDLCKVIGDTPISIVANLPYYAATHIIMKILKERLPITSITVMVQEEVAQRFTAQPNSKQYGIVSVAAQFYSQPRLLFKVSRGSFIPAPNVDSAVIQLTVDNEQLKVGIDEQRFFTLVKSAFSERRKQLCNPVSKELGIDKGTVKSALESIDKNQASRAEELSLQDFIKLYKVLNEDISHRNIM